MSKINIKGTDIAIITQNDEDYISLTDMIKNMDNNNVIISNWMRQKNTLEFLAIWEKTNNPDFKLIEFDELTKDAGLNRFTMSPKKWIETTGAIGVISKSGRYGGTYAHKFIAFHFGLWISPEFNMLLISEFDRLKKEESERIQSGWDYRRFLSKTNYVIHTDAVKEYIIPDLTEEQAKYAYANEADMLNVALFGMTARQWKKNYPAEALKGLNMRDLADVHQLIVLSNLENNNAFLISKGLTQSQRLLELRKNAISQLESLRRSSYTIDKIQSPFKVISSTSTISSGDKEFDKKVGNALKKGKPR